MKAVTLAEDARAQVFTGVNAAAAGYVAYAFARQAGQAVTLVLGSTTRQIERLAEDMAFFDNAFGTDGTRWDVQILPGAAGEAATPQSAFTNRCDRLAALTALRERHRDGGQRPLVLALTPAALFEPVPDASALARHEVRLEAGGHCPFQKLVEALGTSLAYDSEVLCENPGQYSVRGGLIDVYPLNARCPYRIDFFGDDIEAIRAYDPTSQRSGEAVRELVLAPAGALEEEPRPGGLLDLLPEALAWVMHEPADLEADYPDLFNVPERSAPAGPTFADLVAARAGRADVWAGIADIEAGQALFPAGAARRYLEAESLENHRPQARAAGVGVERVEAEARARGTFLKQLLDWRGQGAGIFTIAPTEGEADRLRGILNEANILEALSPGQLRGSLGGGFRLGLPLPGLEAPGAAEGATGLVFVTDGDVFGRHRQRFTALRKRSLPNRSQVDQLLDFSELADGDYLVHIQHGVCIYRGLSKLMLGEREEEVISVEFDGGITLHVRLQESHLLSRYVGLTKAAPKLGKLGTNQWEKTRRAAERATLDLAGELLTLQARRDTQQGHACAPDTAWQHEFEASFPYRETPGQLQAINETKADLEKPTPMDRLICGDVGFGKTEVALRGAFKAALEGLQVAVLVPTTVLCQQHFDTFRERFSGYPIVVEMLSRFRKPGEQRTIKQELAEGRIDVVVGTHSLLAGSVRFKRLGLLIIDEEHRFGVRQKEKIKRLRETVDVLTMSATPIPRTLQFALLGVRDLSVIETAPRDRLPIQTQVKAYDEQLVREAIRFEVDRGGQVFYLHNRVETIGAVAARLGGMLPELRIATGHGQMEEGELEEVMTRFVAGEYDVLVCTTIIESGLDIPNCNTLIIEGADRFGLSQLYQIRGRVGRFNRQAYAYLLLHRHGRLLDQARKRLSAIRQFNQLGAGFRIAMRDLELRGAGNLLGSEQSGHIAGVGFELYCQLLRQSVERLKGNREAAAIRASLRLDFVETGETGGMKRGTGSAGFDALKEAEQAGQACPPIEAALPAHYVGEAKLRIDLYRRLAMAATLGEVREIAETLRDRFGSPPEPAQALLVTTEIRIIAQDKGICTVETDGASLKCQLAIRGQTRFIKYGSRFPRLTTKKPLARLREIRKILKTLEPPRL